MTLLDKAIISLSEEDVQKVADQKDTFNNEKLYGYAMRDLSEIEVSVRVLRLRLGTKDDLAEIEKEFRRIYESLYGVQSMDKGKDGAPSASAGKTPEDYPSPNETSGPGLYD